MLLETFVFSWFMKKLLHKDIQNFITRNLTIPIQELDLRKNPFVEVDYKQILNQIEAKARAKDKLPTWFETENIIYPPKLSIEQTSSETTAQHKSNLIKGNLLIDLTGGFGIDTYYFSKSFQEVIHCEINPELSQIVAHNFEQLQANNIRCLAQDGLEVLKKLNQTFDWVYIDPSRRNDSKGKVVLLKDCLPDVTSLLDEYLNFTDNILIKTSPLYDISIGLSELKFVKTIHIIALENEVKELLFEIQKTHLSEAHPITIQTVNLTKNHIDKFNFALSEKTSAAYSLPQKYLYEPNAAIMKSQGFDHISTAFGINKLHKHSHLYTTDKLIDFPGRIFEIKQTIAYKKQEMKSVLQNTKANITTRNFPQTVAQIRQKWKISEGGNLYCFFTTDIKNEKIVVICEKLKP